MTNAKFVLVRVKLDAFLGTPTALSINVQVPASTETGTLAHDQEYKQAVDKLSLLLTRLVNEETS